MTSLKSWTVVACMTSAVFLVLLRGDTDRVPSSTPLAAMPRAFGPWSSTDVPISTDVLAILGKGSFLHRIYQAAGVAPSHDESAPVDLFIGYFPTQRTGQSIHSPQNCLPGSGWSFESTGVASIDEASGKSYQVGEYVITNGESRQEVLYWYRTHGHSIANDYVAKVRMITDSILYHRTDAALIRVMTPILPGETRQLAHTRAIRFTERISPVLPAFIPD